MMIYRDLFVEAIDTIPTLEDMLPADDFEGHLAFDQLWQRMHECLRQADERVCLSRVEE